MFSAFDEYLKSMQRAHVNDAEDCSNFCATLVDKNAFNRCCSPSATETRLSHGFPYASSVIHTTLIN